VAQESQLKTEDLGDSLDAVEALLKKHGDIEKSLAAQQEKTRALDDFAKEVIGSDHYDAATVQQRRDSVLKRRADLDDLASKRRAQLEESNRLQQVG
jgi:spectrin alpha